MRVPPRERASIAILSRRRLEKSKGQEDLSHRSRHLAAGSARAPRNLYKSRKCRLPPNRTSTSRSTAWSVSPFAGNLQVARAMALLLPALRESGGGIRVRGRGAKFCNRRI